MFRPAIFLVAATTLTGCSLFGSDCAGLGLVRLTPMDTTIHVGDSFAVRYDEGSTCGPVQESDYHSVPLTWTTKDSLVVRIGPAVGRVTGLAIGDAQVAAVERSATIAVHVR
jgi:hypothetical protein